MELQGQRIAPALFAAVVVAAVAADSGCGPPTAAADIDARVLDAAQVDAPQKCGPPQAVQCADCLDNDGDGRIDSADPECTHAGDDEEASFSWGVADECPSPRMMDCYFDFNEISLDDGCALHPCCSLETCPPDLATDFDPSMCTPSAECISVCLPQTVAGCDCLGCCTVCSGGTCSDVLLKCAYAQGCETVEDALAGLCPACTPIADCALPCGEPGSCIMCLGMTASDLIGCDGDPQCPLGRSRCETDLECAVTEFCGNRCCTPRAE